MTLKSTEEYEQQRNKQASRMRAGFDYAMGALIIFIGFFFALRHRFELAINKRFPPDWMDIVLGCTCICYGAWRIYRGYKKKYFK